MSASRDRHVFARSGLAALSDFERPEWRELFAKLEKDQADFLAHEGQFRSPEYRWPRDPLHNWSRAWEYPYAYHHLQEFQRAAGGRAGVPLKALDLGSGVTFFPFALARSGYEVICTDTDPVCVTDLGRAQKLVAHAPGQVSFRLTDGKSLPLADGEVDAVFCISVLEHIPEFTPTIAEVHRVLKPGGLFVLTIDLDLRGDSELGIAARHKLRGALAERFEFRVPPETIHPADMLTTITGPYAMPVPTGWRRRYFRFKQDFVKPLFGRTPRKLIPWLLTVEGLVLQRKGGS